VKVNAPELLEDGGVKVNGALPNSLGAIKKLPNVGAIVFTTNGAVIVPTA
jgi:hypothetical protein